MRFRAKEDPNTHIEMPKVVSACRTSTKTWRGEEEQVKDKATCVGCIKWLFFEYKFSVEDVAKESGLTVEEVEDILRSGPPLKLT